MGVRRTRSDQRRPVELSDGHIFYLCGTHTPCLLAARNNLATRAPLQRARPPLTRAPQYVLTQIAKKKFPKGVRKGKRTIDDYLWAPYVVVTCAETPGEFWTEVPVEEHIPKHTARSSRRATHAHFQKRKGIPRGAVTSAQSTRSLHVDIYTYRW